MQRKCIFTLNIVMPLIIMMVEKAIRFKFGEHILFLRME